MSFNFNTAQSLSNMDDVYTCLNAWSQKMPSIICKKSEEANTLFLTILTNDSSSMIKVTEAAVKHKYKWINEMTSFGVPAGSSFS